MLNNNQKASAKNNATTDSKTPSTEVTPVDKKPQRRRFTAAYKLRILQEAEQCTEPGQIGALLRKEGLYSSHLSNWRRLHRLGEITATNANKRGPKPLPPDVKQELQLLRKQNQQLQQRLAAAETVIEVQKKVSALLNLTDESNEAP